MSVADRQAEIVSEFERFGDWEERYKHLIALGKALPQMAEGLKTEEAMVRGCQSRVWIHARLDGGKVHFEADSDSILVRGLAALLLRVYSGGTPDEIVHTPPDFVNKIRLQSHLTPSRANGLYAMVKQIKFFALAYQTLA